MLNILPYLIFFQNLSWSLNDNSNVSCNNDSSSCFSWYDGDLFTYTNLGYDEPNDFEDIDKNFMMINALGRNNNECFPPYICLFEGLP